MKVSVDRSAIVLPGASRRVALVGLLAVTVTTAGAQALPGQWTDWGGGYWRGPDSASVTIATSGAGTKQPVPVARAPSPAPAVPMTDWGGGYLRGPDSASTTVATSGAGTPKPAR